MVDIGKRLWGTKWFCALALLSVASVGGGAWGCGGAESTRKIPLVILESDPVLMELWWNECEDTPKCGAACDRLASLEIVDYPREATAEDFEEGRISVRARLASKARVPLWVSSRSIRAYSMHARDAGGKDLGISELTSYAGQENGDYFVLEPSGALELIHDLGKRGAPPSGIAELQVSYWATPSMPIPPTGVVPLFRTKPSQKVQIRLVPTTR